MLINEAIRDVEQTNSEHKSEASNWLKTNTSTWRFLRFQYLVYKFSFNNSYGYLASAIYPYLRPAGNYKGKRVRSKFALYLCPAGRLNNWKQFDGYFFIPSLPKITYNLSYLVGLCAVYYGCGTHWMFYCNFCMNNVTITWLNCLWRVYVVSNWPYII